MVEFGVVIVVWTSTVFLDSPISPLVVSSWLDSCCWISFSAYFWYWLFGCKPYFQINPNTQILSNKNIINIDSNNPELTWIPKPISTAELADFNATISNIKPNNLVPNKTNLIKYQFPLLLLLLLLVLISMENRNLI